MSTQLGLVIVLVYNLIASNCYIVNPGPLVIATEGEVWPKPQKQVYSDAFHLIKLNDFKIRIGSETCNILNDAIDRYMHIIVNQTFPLNRKLQFKNEEDVTPPNATSFVGYLNTLDVLLSDPCSDNEIPTSSMLEQYELKITETSSVLAATSVWGILRGLETFTQLLYPAKKQYALQINCTFISDYPRFSYRGLLLDTSRHFIPLEKLLNVLDAAAYNKLNVFHWHITDDQSFPYQSIKYPLLSEKGAYLPTYVYSQKDVAHVIKYAAARGIRVMVELDTPGHTRSWGNAIPKLLTACYDHGVPNGKYGPIDPTQHFTYAFMKELLGEVVEVFHDELVHLGGDEVEFECWSSNPNIKKFMQLHNITSYNKLEGYYMEKLIKITEHLNRTPVVWEEVFNNRINVPKSTIVHVWIDPWVPTVQNVTKDGYKTLLSSCWYLDHLNTGGDWIKFYTCEPLNFNGTETQQKLIMGGESCMWGEVVNEYNLESRIWPRASATAEKLWSYKDADTLEHAKRRLEEHTCRMNKRGIGAQPPNGPGFCEL